MLAAKPDIILDVGTVNDTYRLLADKVQAQTGIPYVLIDGRFTDSGKTLRDVGALLGVADRRNARDPCRPADQGFERQPRQDTSRSKATRLLWSRPGGPETGLAGSINVEILEAAGAETPRRQPARAA